MTKDIAKAAPSSDLAIRGGQTFWTDKQAAALSQLGVAQASNADLAVFFHQVTRTGLDPFAKQIYMIERDGRQTIQTGIDGYRLIARRAADDRGETLGYDDTRWCGTDGEWVDAWLSANPPAAAKVIVRRDGHPFDAVAVFGEYAARKRNGDLTRMWQTKPALMLAKCAEALALRKAFPQELSGIYTSDEMASGRVVDGEVVGTSWSAGEETRPDYERPISEGQQAALHASYDAAGITDRDAKLAFAVDTIGRDITTSNDLTAAEAGQVIDALHTLGSQETPS